MLIAMKDVAEDDEYPVGPEVSGRVHVSWRRFFTLPIFPIFLSLAKSIGAERIRISFLESSRFWHEREDSKPPQAVRMGRGIDMKRDHHEMPYD